MQAISDLLQQPLFEVKAPDKVEYEFQEIGLELEPIYGKLIWTLFYKKGFTEYKIRTAHKIASERGITTIPYLIGIIKKLP